jgi:hypothetical protein
VEFSRWEAEYRHILHELHFSRARDEEAATLLAELLRTRDCQSPPKFEKLRGREVVVVGTGPGSIPLDLLKEKEAVLVAADGATTTCLRAGVRPDIIVTDLDGCVPDEIEANRLGAFVLIHAHGDNMPALRRWVPKFTGGVCGSTAGAPRSGLVNFGGFTDGDRSLFLAEAAGATRATLACFDLEHVRSGEGEEKLKKLRIAARLIDAVAARGVLEVAECRGTSVKRWLAGEPRPTRPPAVHSRRGGQRVVPRGR